LEKGVYGFYRFNIFPDWMTLKLRCDNYGFECEFALDEEKTIGLIQKLRDHFEEEHGIDYTIEAVTQMITNRGHSLESIKK
jgi:predicted small metal-binding protein